MSGVVFTFVLKGLYANEPFTDDNNYYYSREHNQLNDELNYIQENDVFVTSANMEEYFREQFEVFDDKDGTLYYDKKTGLQLWESKKHSTSNIVILPIGHHVLQFENNPAPSIVEKEGD